MEEESTSKNYEEYHEHPLRIIWSRDQADCSRCGQTAVSAPCLGCVDNCGFYLHQVCADAPWELINHPFHPDHPSAPDCRLLLSKSLYPRSCNFCGMTCREDHYAYRCSYLFGSVELHIRCALFTFNIAHNNFKDLEHVALLDPLPVSTQIETFDEMNCFFCRERLESYTHYDPYCGFNAHEKCVKLPPKLNHPCHRKHPLSLVFHYFQLSNCCNICQDGHFNGLLYFCSSCEFAIDVKCVSPSPTIEDKTYHPHPFNLYLRQASFICDSCGTDDGRHAAYTCLECNIQVHKECISRFPRFIRSVWHDHRLSHTYFRHKQDSKNLYCVICHEEVDANYGNYSCKFCDVIILHAKCATFDEGSYEIVPDDEEHLDASLNSFTVVETNEDGEATVIEHFKHTGHRLMLSDRVSEYDDNCCDGCLLPISASFYHCSVSNCDFVLHKVCAEFPKKKQVQHHYHSAGQQSVLTVKQGFGCSVCESITTGFGYMCEECEEYITCLRCIIALTPGARTHPVDERPFFYYSLDGGKCEACGKFANGMFRPKEDDFCLDRECFSLPITARHICDEHRLSLTYHDENSYSESHYCDICEDRRQDPDHWFYHCATCDTCAHVNCVIDTDTSFLKIGRSMDNNDFHEHPVTIVKNMYYYPDCSYCGKPCVDVSLECRESGCNFIAHVICP